MERSILHFSSIILLICFSQCRPKEQPGIYTEADSLLNLTLDLQARINSPEIQRLLDFQDEINEDLAILRPAAERDTLLIRYIELYNGLGQCMEACNQFHEETFLLEYALRDIMEQVRMKNADLESLESMFLFELENFNDLSGRMDSSINLAMHQAEIYYAIKPGIRKIMEGMDSIPDQMP